MKALPYKDNKKLAYNQQKKAADKPSRQEQKQPGSGSTTSDL